MGLVHDRRMAAAVALLVTVACTSTPAVPPLTHRPPGNSSDVRFVDAAAGAGLEFRHGAFRWDVTGDPVAMMGSGVCWLDYDGDGRLDLYSVNSYSQQEAARWIDEEGSVPSSALFRNVGGRFEDVTARSGAGVAARGSGCVAADLNSDGHSDLYVTTANRAYLFWNQGDGSFREGASEAGVEAFGWHTGAAAGDVNGDGWMDLFVAGYVDMNVPRPEATQGFPSTFGGVRDLLYVSRGGRDGRVTFEEVGERAGLETAAFEYGLGAVFSDADRDGDLDLYVANDTNPNRFYRNVAWPGGARADPEGLGFRFEEMAGRAGVADANSGMGVAAGDYDSDGRGDLFVTNSRNQMHAAFRARSPVEGPRFVDARPDFGEDLAGSTAWGVSWLDADLDSDLDLVLVNGAIPVRDLARDVGRVEAFENTAEAPGPLRLVDAGPRWLAAAPKLVARGSAAADYDNDGDLDLAVNQIGGDLVLLENRAEGGNSLIVDLGGVHPGARIAAVLDDGRRLVREVHAGSSYLSSEDPRAHFGLGGALGVARLVVSWPGGEQTVLTDIEANRIVEVDAP